MRYLSLDKQQGKRIKKEVINEFWLIYKKTRELITHNYEEKELVKKIESITKSLQKQYFKNSLVTLSKKNIENARTICNYIIAEQTEINIKDSTKEGKIKILIWLSNHFHDQKSFQRYNKIWYSWFFLILVENLF
jgi:hypothetical protein